MKQKVSLESSWSDIIGLGRLYLRQGQPVQRAAFPQRLGGLVELGHNLIHKIELGMWLLLLNRLNPALAGEQVDGRDTSGGVFLLGHFKRHGLHLSENPADEQQGRSKGCLAEGNDTPGYAWSHLTPLWRLPHARPRPF